MRHKKIVKKKNIFRKMDYSRNTGNYWIFSPANRFFVSLTSAIPRSAPFQRSRSFS